MRPVAIMAATMTGNRGAETMLCALTGRLREKYPQSVIHIFSYYPHEDARAVKDPGVRIHGASPLSLLFIYFPLCLLQRILTFLALPLNVAMFSRRVTALARCGVMVDIAGEAFRDGREVFLPFKVLTVLPARWLNVPVIKMSQALGPMNRPWTAFAARTTLRACHAVTVRGLISEKYLVPLPETTQILRAADLGFLYRPQDSLTYEHQKQVNAALKTMKASSGWIGFSPNILGVGRARHTGRNYVKWYKGLILALYRMGYRICLFPNASRDNAPYFWQRNNDIPLIRRIERAIAADVPGTHRLAIDFTINTSAIRRITETCDMVLAARFHAMISALCTGTPVLVMCRLHKYREVMEEFGLEHYVMEEATADTGEVMIRMRELVQKKVEIRRQILDKLPAMQRSAESQLTLLDDLLHPAPEKLYS